MRIDPDVEQHVRNALHGAVIKDIDQMVTAVGEIPEAKAKVAFGMGWYVCSYVLNDVYRDGITDDQANALAQKIFNDGAGWANLESPEKVAIFLKSTARGDASFDGLSADDILAPTFVIGAYLLTTARLDNEHWWDYLDKIWAALLNEPEPSGT